MEQEAGREREIVSAEIKRRSSIEIVVPELNALPIVTPKQKSWDDFEVEYLRKFYPQRQYPIMGIAICLGRSVDSVERKAWKLGLRRNQ